LTSGDVASTSDSRVGDGGEFWHVLPIVVLALEDEEMVVVVVVGVGVRVNL
jgi:hypothetical protein